MADITNQPKLPYVIISTDMSNYFDQIAHLISVITFLYFSLPPFQELIQGNGVASLGFMLITIILICRLYQKELVSTSLSPIF